MKTMEEPTNKLNEIEDNNVIEVPLDIAEKLSIKTIDIVELANKLHDIVPCRSIIIEEPMLTWDYNNTYTQVTFSKESLTITKVNGKEEFTINTFFCPPVRLPIKVTDEEGTHRNNGQIYYKFDFWEEAPKDKEDITDD